MAGRDRTPEQIRAEIRAERTQLDAALDSLAAEAKRSARHAGAAVAALGGLRLAARLLARTRRD